MADFPTEDPVSTLAFCLFLVLVCFAAVHTGCAAAALLWKARPVTDSTFQPAAAVVLSVRGRDPTLPTTLTNLIQQDYESLQIHVIFDHPADEAWDGVREVVREHDRQGRCHLHTLAAIPKDCGLKCAAIAQVVRQLVGVEVVATIDADVAPHPTWLRELVAPLADSSIGVATGNHWFEPEATNAGSLVRSLWNAGALIPTSFFGNPWGGACAMRLVDIHQSGLLEAWEKSIVDDGPIRQACAKLKQRIVFLPSLIMINRERCSLAFCANYMSRILTWSRVYENAFRWTVAHLLVNGIPLVLAALLLVVAGVRGDSAASLFLLAGLAGHAILFWLAYLLVRRAVARIVRARGERFARLGLLNSLRFLIAMPLALAVYALSVIRAIRSRFICWRGVWYYVSGRTDVMVLSYQPSTRSSNASGDSRSI